MTVQGDAITAVPPERSDRRQNEIDASPGSDPRRRLGKSEILTLLLLIAIGPAVRIAALSLWPPAGLTGDELDYVELARRWVRTGEFDAIARAPGYVWFLGLIFRLPFDDVTAAQYVQIGLSAVAVMLIYGLGRREIGGGAALAAAAMFVVDPTMIAYSHYLFSEALYIPLILAAAWFWMRARRTGAFWATLLSGLLLGGATLVRGVTAAHLALLLVWMLVMPAPRVDGASAVSAWKRYLVSPAHALTLLLAWSVVVLPWSWTLYQRHGGFVLVDMAAARTLWHANRIDYKPAYDWGIGDPETIRRAERKHSIKHPSLERETYASTKRMLETEKQFLIEHPGQVISRAPGHVAALWNPTTFLHRRIARSQMATVERASTTGFAISLATSLFYAITLFLGVVGLWHARRGPLRSFTLIMLVAYVGVHAVMVSLSRYRVPVMPFVLLFAGAALCDVRRHFAPKSWRTWAATVTIATIAVSWYPYRAYALLQVDETKRGQIIRSPQARTPPRANRPPARRAPGAPATNRAGRPARTPPKRR